MYKFDPQGEPVEMAFRQIALSQLDEALGEIDRHDGHGRSVVHEVRRRCKKLRGLLRLVRPAFPEFAGENAAIRDAAALLSHIRDAEVLRLTIDGLGKAQPEAAEPLTRISLRLAEEGRHAGPADAGKLEAFRKALLEVRARAEHWSLTRTGLDALLPGLRRSYRSDRRRMEKAQRTRLSPDLHEWRKANKAHGFHIDLLKKTAPEVLTDALRSVDHVSSLLGHHHDLTVLGAAVAQDPARFGDEADIAALNAAIGAQTAQLEAAAFDLGRQVLAERPRELARHFERYWKSAG
ncbi:MAG: CHAD domain-containing protein [Devosia nanyangense]|uniref:CHAD domain-containing protein n=1 Tax=Devosia nanyangense TaxID=1228055 RepID=A0A933KYZ6_9HYPH|nr:CHAD domain-containing protein [Devosia nanyangense]